MADEANWPEEVALTEAVEFPAVIDGRQVGSVMVPAGTTVRVVTIREQVLMAEHAGGQSILRWGQTDLQNRVEAEAQQQ